MDIKVNIDGLDFLKMLPSIANVIPKEHGQLFVFIMLMGLIAIALILLMTVAAFLLAYEDGNLSCTWLLLAMVGVGVTAVFYHVGATTVATEDAYNQTKSECWNRFLRRWVIHLSTTIDQSHWDVILEWYSTANLICSTKKHEMFEMTQNLTKDETKGHRGFRLIHYNLLVDHIAKTGEECFVIFCKIFLQNPKYANIGLKMCRSCEVCCSTVLNGTWSNADLLCSVPTELNLPLNVSFDQESETIADFAFNGDTCRKSFNEKKAEIQRNLHPIKIHVINVDDYDGCQTERRCLVVHEASLYCSEEGLVARLTVNVEEEAVDQVKLIKLLADMTYVKPSQLNVSIGPKNSTLIRLRLPPQAGMELLSIVSNSERKRLFLNALSSAICSLADFVSVSVQISALPPIKMFFVPKEATSWFNEGNLKFYAKAVENEVEYVTKGMCHFSVLMPSP